MSAPSSPRASIWQVFLLGAATGLVTMAAVHEYFLHRAPDVELYRDVRELVSDSFVDDVDPDDLVDDALRGMLTGLDPYSRFYDAAEVARVNRETSGTFTGLGVVFRPPTSDLQVLFPVPGAPADGAIRVGDRLLAIDGDPLDDPGELQERVGASNGTELQVEVEGLDGERRTVGVTPAAVLDPTVRHARMLDHDRRIGYVAITSFSHETPSEFDSEVGHLVGDGLRALIIDLRDNPGGVLRSATDIANRFIPAGNLVVTRGRNQADVFAADPKQASLEGLPLVLLVDGGSASASEVVAGAVQDFRVGVVVGEPTYGKGMVQTLTPYGHRAVVKLTTSLYYTPANRQIDRAHGSECDDGIEPDLFVPTGESERGRVHRQLASYGPPRAAAEAIAAWEAAEGTRLVEPWPEDAQLAAALKLLLGDGGELR